MKSAFYSSNGILVKVSVEMKSQSGVFGRDFVTGGSVDYFSRFKEGFYITAKRDVFPSNLGELLKNAVYKILGSYPIVMPQTFASHLYMIIWEGALSQIDESDVLSEIGRQIQQSAIILGNDCGQAMSSKYWEILKLKPGASKEEIQAAFRIVAAQYHPDKLPLGATPEQRELIDNKMKDINEAYNELMKEA